MADSKKKEVATQTQADVPAFLQGKVGATATGRGAEDVGMDDLTLPRIEVVQSLSKCRDKDEPEYIEGISEGELYNTLTRENYGDKVLVIPVCFKKEFLVWVKANEGGGFKGSFETAEEARGAMAAMEEGDKLEMNDTSVHFVLIVAADGSVSQAVISMAKSKRKVSRQWNSMMRMNGGDTFTCVYEINGVSQKNNDGQKFYNMAIKNAGYVNEEQYAAAEAMYEAVQGGAFKIDREDQEGSGTMGDVDITDPEM